MDHDVRSVIELEIRDSALRLYFVEAGITLLQSFDPNALTITYSSKIEVGGATTLVSNEGADLEFVDGVVKIARTNPGRILCVLTISGSLAAEALRGCVYHHF